MASFSTTLKRLRKERQWRQSDLSQALGLSQATIANYEQGTRFPDEAVLNSLANHLGVSTDVLLGRSEAAPPARVPVPLPVGGPPKPVSIDELDHQIGWLLAGDFGAFQAVLDQRWASGWSVAQVHVGLIQPLMDEVGRRWERGALDVYQEHVISEQVKRHVAHLSSSAPQNPKGPRFLGLAVSGELHDLGIRMVSDILQWGGWNARYLGTNVPPSSLLAAVGEFQPQVIGLSVGLASHVAIAQQTIYYLRNELKDHCPAIMVGGFAFRSDHELAATLGADALAIDGNQVLERANALTRAPSGS